MNLKRAEAVQDVREVLRAILDHNGHRWLRFITAVLRNRADAEDVIQEAVRRFLTRDVPFYSEEQIRSYLGRAINNAALERYNARKRERLRQVPFMDHFLLPTRSPSPHDCIEQYEQSAENEQMLLRLQEGLTHLPLKQHEALRLTIMESRGRSIRDVGMNNGIPYSTLRHRSKQALRSLRRYLKRSSQNRSQKTENRRQNG